jgi:hypothetical protein
MRKGVRQGPIPNSTFHVQINLYTLHMPILKTKQSSYKCLPDTPQEPPATSRSRESTVFHSRRTPPPVSLIHVINAKSVCRFKYFPYRTLSKPAKSARFDSHGGCQMRCIASTSIHPSTSLPHDLSALPKTAHFPATQTPENQFDSLRCSVSQMLYFTTLSTPSSTCQCSTLTQSSQQ